jgi:glycerol-1-phosphate dehydrogenase [NAD(P)+]
VQHADPPAARDGARASDALEAAPAEAVAHRSIRIPRLLRIVHGRPATIDVLEELASDASGGFLVVHSGLGSGTGYGAALVADARGRGLEVRDCHVERNSEEWVQVVVAAIEERRPSFVAGVGGGRVVDVAKLAAARCGVDFLSLPTQAASDGICSPVAVMVDDRGRPTSLGARVPAGIIVDLDVLRSAPRETWLSGLGDLVSNLSAVLDWRLAHDEIGEEMDDFACLTAEAAAASVIEDDADLGDDAYQHKLIRGLILSGIAMEMAGSSRPASGSEHLISHALDRILPQPRHHGLQVALATLASYRLRGDGCDRLVRFYRAVGLPVLPRDIGIEVDHLMQAVAMGRSTRPGRWTVLDRAGTDDVMALRQLYERGGEGVWD